MVILGVLVFMFRYHVIKLLLSGSRIGENISSMKDTRKKLETENSNLSQRITELESQVAGNTLLQTENENLRSLLKYTKNPQQIITTAAVLSSSRASLSGQIIINQGAGTGIAEGDLVTLGDHVLLGTITKVYEKTAVIDVYSRNGYSNEAGFVIKNLGVHIDGKGNGNGNFILQVPNNIQVVDGDVIILPAYPDMVVGVIKSIESDPRDPFQKVIARTPVNINELKFVQVVRP
jgi:rod shape-determining protein MreC